MSYTDVLERIEALPHYRTITCSQCGHTQRFYSLLVNADCEECHTHFKLRSFVSIGGEIEDVVDAVLAWLGEGQEFELAMARKRVIDSSSD